ncbi:hypothetical protein [Halocynthiibacter styelae]|uniref:Uncharacterized protein n=1 Tax=Halocynthiibacter styelae TaxID=2761955 RepID=A0A8J7IRL4_9RHOB|nr:hypothetical protein [Paenihalocynthiibacter styelae]MBI1494196.1 hypothetical protein [Paenihalocynthiibacter styelae]
MQTATPSIPHAVVAVIIFGGLLLFIGHQQLFFAHEQTFVVLRNDAARDCYTRSNSKFERLFGWDENVRSERPENGLGHFCGFISTSMGDYTLPEQHSYAWLPWDMPRTELDDDLIAGCMYRVRIVGYGGKHERGQSPRKPIRQHISRIYERLSCGYDTARENT